jgi:hypothetical protein
MHNLLTVWNELAVEVRQTAIATPGVLSTLVWYSRQGAYIPPPYDSHQDRVLAALQRLLEEDDHLSRTCVDAQGLARALDAVGLGALANTETAPDLKRLGEDAVDLLFREDYVRRAYFRFYNLDLRTATVSISPLRAFFEEMADRDIPRITGEITPTSTLHLPNTGNAFLVFEDTDADDDVAWWKNRWQDATHLLRVLQYFKYGVVDIDYSIIHFTPEWVNLARRYGIPMWGRPRTDVQDSRYVLGQGEQDKLLRYILGFAQYRSLFEDFSPSLRQAIATAGDYYEGHHSRTKPEDQLIDLSVALEALFSPSDRVELQFRVSQSAALLIGQTADSRMDIANFIREAYRHRSSLVHGGASPFPRNKFTRAELARLGDLVREAILRVSVLYARDRKTREVFLGELERSALNAMGAELLRKRSEVDAFLSESGL